jgi:ABC-2 type transport system permease protein
MIAKAPIRMSLVNESLVFARQLLTRWRRDPVVPVQAILFPTFLLVTYYLLVGQSMMRITGTNSLYGLVPTCAVAGGLSGAFAAGLAIPGEREGGLLTKFWALPVHRSSVLIGRVLAEAARTVISTVLITVVGIGLGLRFEGSWLDGILYILVPVVVVVVFSMAVMAFAVRSKQGSSLIWLGVPVISAVFASSGAPPINMLPSWMWPLLELQPMTPVIGSMRALAHGDSATSPLLHTAIWSVCMAAVVGPLAVRGYRLAAETAG